MPRTRDRGIRLCAHLILGFPWETREEMLRTAEVISEGCEFFKAASSSYRARHRLESEYRAKPFPLLGLEEYADLVVDFLERLSPDIYH